MKTTLRLTVAAFVVTAFNLNAATLYVSLQSTNPVAPYATWETAATVIQDAVDISRDGDTVLVGDGVYTSWDQRSQNWSPPTIPTSIILKSVNGPRDTLLDGGGWARCIESLAAGATLSGFTLTNGWHSGAAGGIWCESPAAVVTNCVLVNNYAGGSGIAGTGGGVVGGTLYFCTLVGNFGMHRGGGASCSTLFSCRLIGNTARYGGGADRSSLHNCTVTDNTAYVGGVAFDCELFSCTVVGNSTGVDNGVSPGCGGASTVLNCILYYNAGGNYGDGTILNYCLTSPLPTNGIGNITGPPLFMDMAAGDFRLREGSPCIDGGTNLFGLPIRVWRWGMGDCVISCSVRIAADILGNARGVDGNGDGKGGWDIGAYEFNSFPPPRFSSPPRLTSDGWKLNLTGAHNKWVHVQRSSNLKDWEEIWYDWMGATGEKQLIDGDTGQRVMFYRAFVE